VTSTSKPIIEVRIAGRGVVRGGDKTVDAETKAVCDLCGAESDAVVSVGGAFACKGCLRGRLEAVTVAAWELRGADGGGLPWGKVSG